MRGIEKIDSKFQWKVYGFAISKRRDGFYLLGEKSQVVYIEGNGGKKQTLEFSENCFWDKKVLTGKSNGLANLRNRFMETLINVRLTILL